MKKYFSISTALLLSLFISIQAGQQKQPAPAKDEQDAGEKNEVVKISVTLVQIDAVVTDDKGRQVTDLKAEDFELYEDGRRQHISNFNYIAAPVASAPPPEPAGKANKSLPPGPPVNLRPEQVRRTIALVVDDLGLSFESTAQLRDSLKKFVNEQMQPGDLVAIIRTGAGMGALQQFTNDKRQLYAAIERVKWNPLGRGGISAFAPIERENRNDLTQGGQGGQNRREREREAQRLGESIEQLREDVFAVGTLGALNFVVRGLRDLPGRKSVILFSDGFKLFRRDGLGENNQRILESLRRLTDLANRASVVVYTIDARGLQTLSATAADGGLDPQEMARKLGERRDEFYDTQQGLNYLANETGGLFIRNTNDLNRGIGRVLEDQKGYYLLGYVPEASTFRAEKGLRKFHKFSLKVKRAGLKVRTRTGFFGIADEERPAQRTPAQQLFSALVSPFASGDIHLKLTSVFGHDAKAGSFVSSMLHIEGKDLTLAAVEGGFHQGIVNIAAVTFSDNGRVVDQNGRAYTLRVNDEQYQRILKQGFLTR